MADRTNDTVGQSGEAQGGAEEWRPVHGWEGVYEASNLGRVRSLPRRIIRSDGSPLTLPGKTMTPHVHRNRRFVTLSRAGDHKPYPVAILVLLAFAGARPPGQQGCHNDGDSMNDVLTNLRWDTASENVHDTVRHRTHANAAKTHCPLGHPLAPPNLVASYARKGGRHCRTCNTAVSYARRARMAGLPYDIQYESDRIYARIMQRECV